MRVLRRDGRAIDRGEVTERPKVHDWKSCVRKRTEGSNPSFSAREFGLIAGSCATKARKPRQVREEATVASYFVCRRGAWLSFFYGTATGRQAILDIRIFLAAAYAGHRPSNCIRM